MNRIVVIEDDPAIRRGLADNLRTESYDVLTANDGEGGCRLVYESQPDLVILDLMLPRLNGYEVCRQLRRHGLTTPILMLTAQDQEESRVAGFEVGADDYVTKPFSVRELLGRIRAILRRDRNNGLQEARQVQDGLLPTEFPEIPGVGISAFWRPAYTVSGDYFDVLKLDDATAAVCIADVCGKGIPAAMMMANLQATLRAIAKAERSPGALCTQLNRVTCANTPAHSFISLFFAVIDVARSRLTYCNAGHNPPILVTQARSVQKLNSGGGILGVFKDWEYEEGEVHFNRGDSVLMYTDGITESRDARGQEFGETRLMDVVRGPVGPGSEGLKEAVVRAARQFNSGHFEDDATILAVTRVS